jgi:hypothetical protein
MMRAMTSGEEPGPYGTSNLMGREGQLACANAAEQMTPKAKPMIQVLENNFMM